MNVKELKEHLEGYPDDMEVKLAQQPNWPFQYSIGDIVEAKIEDDNEDSKSALFIGECEQEQYLSGDASRELGWE